MTANAAPTWSVLHSKKTAMSLFVKQNSLREKKSSFIFERRDLKVEIDQKEMQHTKTKVSKLKETNHSLKCNFICKIYIQYFAFNAIEFFHFSVQNLRDVHDSFSTINLYFFDIMTPSTPLCCSFFLFTPFSYIYEYAVLTLFANIQTAAASTTPISSQLNFKFELQMEM